MSEPYYHLVPDDVLVRNFGEPGRLHCYCCGEAYRRGEYRCCKPPNGMASEKWMALMCPMPNAPTPGCGKCVKHCQCPNKQQRIGEGPLAQLGRDFLAEYGRGAA